MISTRRLSGENCGNGVSYRVAVCRKRLRVNRSTPRAAAKIQLDEQSRPPGGGIDLIPAPRPNTYSLTPPSIALERQTLSPQSDFADPVPGRDPQAGSPLGMVDRRELVEAGPLEVGAEEKAEDT